MAKWFLKNHDFIHVNSSVAGKYNEHKQDGSHLGFPIRMILATVDLQVTSILPINFESVVLSVQEKKFKTDFQDGHHGRNLGFSIANLVFFIYKSPQCFLPSFESIGLSVQKKKGKIDFQDGRHLGFLTGRISAIFISTNHPDAFYQFSNQLALWFRKINKKRPWRPSWISDPNNLSYFRSTSHPNASYRFESNGFSVQEKKRKIDFQDGCHGGHLGFLIRTILAMMLPT